MSLAYLVYGLIGEYNEINFHILHKVLGMYLGWLHSHDLTRERVQFGSISLVIVRKKTLLKINSTKLV